MNNDELQKAIDDITKENAPVAEAAPAVDTVAENEQLANELAGATAPVAPALEAPDFEAAPAPAVPETPGMPPMPETPVASAPEAPAEASAPEPVAEAAPASAPAPEPEPVAEAAPAVKPEIQLGNTEMIGETPAAPAGDTLHEAMRELYPLLDRVSMTNEEKFDICMQVEDAQAVAKALEYAKQFTDETQKANALLEIINKAK